MLLLCNRRARLTTPGLVLHLDAQNSQSWTAGSTTWYDLSGTGSNGTVSGSPATNSVQGSLIYDGINDVTYCAHSTAVDIRRTFTISVWFKMAALPATTAWTNLFSKQSTTDANQPSRTYALWINTTGTLYLCTADTTGQEYITNPTGFSINTWYNYIGTVDRTNGALASYVNGAQVATGSVRLTDTTSHAGPVCIGQAPVNAFTAEYFKGEIAIAQLYNRTFTSSEALNHFNSFKSRFGL